MQTSPSLPGIVEQKRKFHRLIRFSMRNRGQFKIHRGVRLSRVYKSVYHKEDSRCSTMFLHPLFPITSKGRRASNLIDRFNRIGGVSLCKLWRRDPPPLKTKQTIVIVLRSRVKNVNEIPRCFLPFPSPLSSFSFIFRFDFPSIRCGRHCYSVNFFP